MSVLEQQEQSSPDPIYPVLSTTPTAPPVTEEDAPSHEELQKELMKVYIYIYLYNFLSHACITYLYVL